MWNKFWEGFSYGISGMAMLFCPPKIEVDQRTPHEAIAEDWRRVGSYLREAMHGKEKTDGN